MSMRRMICALCILLSATRAGSALGQTPTNPVTHAAAAVPQPAAGGSAEDIPRDPFWPVNWRPPKPRDPAETNVVVVAVQAPKSVEIKWEEALRNVRWGGCIRGADGRYIATLKGIGTVEEGQVFSLTYGNVVYRWRVKEITSTGIVLPERVEAVPLE